MSTLDSYPAIINALDEFFSAQGANNNVAWDRVVIPEEWVDRFNTAEAAADSLIELSIADVVPEDQLNTETTSREMSAVTALTEDGEIKGLIYSNTENGLVLKEVLEACVEGDLHPLLQANLEDDEEVEVDDEELVATEEEEEEFDEDDDDDDDDEEEY